MPLSQIVSASIEDGAVAPVDLSSNAQFYNYKNKIINGSFQVWQRATTYALTGSFAYGSADRWAFAMGATAAGTASQVASGLTGFQYALKLSRNSGSTSTGFIYADQVVENANTYDLQGQNVTVSFWAKAGANYSAAGSVLGLTVNTGAGSTDSSSLTATFGGWTGNAVPYNNNITITTTWTRYSVTFTVGSTITNIGILFTFPPTGTAGADDAVYITGVQLEKGVTATSFDYRPYGTELVLCQRYYQIKTTTVTTASIYVKSVDFMVQMRSAPSPITTTFDVGTGATFLTYGGGPATNGVYQNTNHSSVATATIRLEAEL